jgi:pimeloyl-ACP methyl ester carboxylesterase
MHDTQPRLLVIWGKYDLSFDPSEPHAYERDVPSAEVHVLDAGHFALDTAADQIALLVRTFLGSSRWGYLECTAIWVAGRADGRRIM